MVNKYDKESILKLYNNNEKLIEYHYNEISKLKADQRRLEDKLNK